MPDQTKEINIIELLMTIKEDVSSIKTDMANFKEAQRIERENTLKEIDEVEKKIVELDSNYRSKLSELETRVTTKITGQQSVLNNLVGEVDTLRHAEEKKDAKKWKTIVAFACTSIGSMLLVKLPDFIAFCLNVYKIGGQ
jgi:nitrate/nitrite-specific signal transduction histidine kinase